jgi:hypothetical protein
MALGDGIRRDIALVDAAERDRFIQAIVKLDTAKFFPDGVTYWDKQEDIHKNAHFAGVDVHGGPGFVPWHRVIVNRLEELLREVDPELSLHYWNWTTDPRVAAGPRAALFTPSFMGEANGDAGHLLADFESTEGGGHDKIWRDVGATAANPDGTPAIDSDATILAAGTDFATLAAALKQGHDFVAHSYIGGTLTQPHYSFHDPFVFLLHSNLDRLWAKWQTEPGHADRMSPGGAYAGLTAGEITTLATENVEPWAGGTGLEPWASDPTKRAVITYTDISVVTPACYDTNGSTVRVLEAENPLNAMTNRYQVVFNDVPEEETTWRAAVIRVFVCSDITLRVKPGTEPAAPFLAVSPFVLTKHKTNAFVNIRFWFEFTAGAVGTAPQSLGPVNTTLVCDETAQEFNFELSANTIHRETVAVELALDQSFSMSWEAGTSGVKRLDVLKDASSLFVSLIQPNNGIGIIRFDDNAYPPNDPTYGGMEIKKVVSKGFGDGARIDANTAISAHGAHGNTSVGDGLVMARSQLNALPMGSYDHKAIIVLTDGIENREQWIANVAGSIDNRTFAVGLGSELQVNTQALTALSGSTGGYLLLSGLLNSSVDDGFRMRKFFMQILANVTNTSIVRDPIGYINVGARIKVLFQLSEADINCRVILLTDFPVVKLSVEAPNGIVIDETNAAGFGVTFDTTTNIKTASFNLPLAFASDKIHAGDWFAVLEIDEPAYQQLFKRPVTSFSPAGSSALGGLKAKGAKYCVSVHSFSNLRMNATISQSDFVPGATLSLRTSLTEYTLPVEGRAAVRAELEYPDHTRATLWLGETQPGVFETSLVANPAGIYRFNVIAAGGTFRGKAFTREQLLTAAVFADVKNPPGQDGDLPGDNGLVGIDDSGTGVVGVIERCCRNMGLLAWIIIALLIILIVLQFWRR